MISAQEQVRQIKHGVADLINEQDLVKKIEKSIKENKPLVVKLGLDPTAPYSFGTYCSSSQAAFIPRIWSSSSDRHRWLHCSYW